MTNSVLCEIADGIATLTLNRPDKGNAIDGALGRDLIAAIDRIAAERSLRAVLLAARGKAFCVGGDIGEMQHAGARLSTLMQASLATLHQAIHKLATLPVPIVSAVQGAIGGGGMSLALCADLVLAAESMKLRGGYSAIGLTPDLGASWFLARRTGPARAKEILFCNRVLDSAECRQHGIVDAVHPDAELADQAAQLVRQLGAGATLSLGRIKRLVDGAARHTLEEHLALECDFMIASGASQDGQEGVAAFIEKRAPRFSGR